MLDRLLRRVRAGESAVLVVRGEAGVGKTALLGAHCSSGRRGVGSCGSAGVESEMELAFAGLHQLCAPMLGGLDGLPGPQRDALRVAFGLQDGAAPNRFLVALAVLSLLAEAAEVEPLVCLVDDAQWLDRASVQALAFVARRLLAERIAMVFAVREPNDADELTGLPELRRRRARRRRRPLAAGVGAAGAAGRARPRSDRRRDARQSARAARAAARFDAGRAGGRLRTSRRESRWPAGSSRASCGASNRFRAETQRLLLVAAAEPVGDVTLLWRAAERLGIGGTRARPAEEAAVDRARHPGAVPSSAGALGGLPGGSRGTASRRIARWPKRPIPRPTPIGEHGIARTRRRVSTRRSPVELERSADRAQRRGGVAAAAAFLERAAELTPDPARRGARRSPPRRPSWRRGAARPRRRCSRPRSSPRSTSSSARDCSGCAAQIAFVFDRGSDAPPLLVDAARRLEALDPALARETYLEALGAAMYAGRVNADSGVLEVAEAARAAPPAPQPPRSIDLVLDGMARRCTEGPGAGVPALRLALQAVRNEALDGHAEIMRWLLLTPIVQSMTVFELWDDDAFHALATRAVRLARDTGALALLPVALVYRSAVHLFGGEFAAAEALVQEADAIAVATGNARPAVRLAARRRLARRRSRSHGVHQRRPREHDRAIRGQGGGPGRLCRRRSQQRLGSLRGGHGRCQARQRRRRLWVLRRSIAGTRRGGNSFWQAGGRLAPRCPGWKSGHSPRARIGRSESWHVHER